ncbi:MAG: ATP-binding protein [Clostridiales Family XIII bacterium]|jgi:MinD-like ATPase involved in chromosome partitioning or flagellar assembly|nr:ATP-binding protein [Clostridiales Family XIII bacterium]
MTRYECFIGNFGSGKTELTINMVRRAMREGKSAALVDIDIVNPYFKSSSKRGMLESEGIKVAGPRFTATNVDIPALPGEISGIIRSDLYDFVGIDVGGDPIGARTLGRYMPEVAPRRELFTFNFVVNVLRPFTNNLRDIVKMANDIMAVARVRFDYIINNTNLAEATSPEEILESQKLIEEASEALEIPFRFISVRRDVAARLRGHQDFLKNELPIEEIDIHMRPDWFGNTR